MAALARVFALFVVTAIAEITGCYLADLWMKKGASSLVLMPAALSLAIFAGLLTLHPYAAGRVYAAYGGVYVMVALAWLWAVESVRPTLTDCVGAGVCVLGTAVIVLGARAG